MAENPLLPHRRLKELHTLMVRCRELESGQPFARRFQREAMLAATAIQIEEGDLFCGEFGDRTTELLVDRSRPKAFKRAKAHQTQSGPPPYLYLPLCAGMAEALRKTGDKHVVFAVTSEVALHESSGDVLTYAQNARLPFVVLCAAELGQGKAVPKQTRFGLDQLTAATKRAHLPILTVDGEDAVAVYRVVQESALRARMGDGPAVIWCFFNKRKSSAARSTPLEHMEQYLATRGLKPSKQFSSKS